MSKPKTIKISIAGDKGVGRSKLFMAWSKGEPIQGDTKIWETVRPFKKPIEHNGVTYNGFFWDTPTEDRVRLRGMNYSDSRCIILCFALDNPATFNYITTAPPEDAKVSQRTLIEEVRDILEGKPIILVGSKSDLERQVTKEQAEKLANDIKATYMEFNHNDWSAMTAIYNMAVKLAVEDFIANPKSSSSESGSGSDSDDEKTVKPPPSSRAKPGGGDTSAGGQKDGGCPCSVL